MCLQMIENFKYIERVVPKELFIEGIRGLAWDGWADVVTSSIVRESETLTHEEKEELYTLIFWTLRT